MSEPNSSPRKSHRLTAEESLALALSYIRRHPTRYLFPIKPGAKFPPTIKNNLRDASNNEAQIRVWCQKWPGCNWGLSHKKSKTLVVDIDVKGDKRGQQTFDLLDLMDGFPETEKTITPSGGFHLIYEGEHIFALGEYGFGSGVDSPNYSLIAGCKFDDGTQYIAATDLPAAPAPAWFYDLLGRRKAKRVADAGEAAIDSDKDENIKWSIDFLQNDAEPAIEGNSGDLQTLKVAMGLRDRGISETMALDLMLEHFNEKCEPPWSPEMLEIKVRNAYTYASQSQLGGGTAEADFAEDSAEDAAASIKVHASPKTIAQQKKQRRECKASTDQPRRRLPDANRRRSLKRASAMATPYRSKA
jgi:Bifunctional DNA primase/polymerase, N-terminal